MQYMKDKDEMTLFQELSELSMLINTIHTTTLPTSFHIWHPDPGAKIENSRYTISFLNVSISRYIFSLVQRKELNIYEIIIL